MKKVKYVYIIITASEEKKSFKSGLLPQFMENSALFDYRMLILILIFSTVDNYSYLKTSLIVDKFREKISLVDYEKFNQKRTLMIKNNKNK